MQTSLLEKLFVQCLCLQGKLSLVVGDLLGIEQLERGDYIFLRVAASELQLINSDSKNTTSSSKPRDKKQFLLTAALPVMLIMLISGFFAFFLRKINLKRKGGKVTSQDLMSFDFNTKMQAMNGEFSDISKKVSKRWDAELPFFNLASISTASDNFKDANMLGSGGFGPVYKVCKAHHQLHLIEHNEKV
ncbi:hypothetical protein Syun_023026 [Stephania yunnanensis]|uniref:Uncharacterized protein n=1 Tax=Stephania yunnanensis TaxID=152371 RepID=A0AAP0FAL0_9MAGN